MRMTRLLALLGAASVALLPGCTVKKVEQPPLAGPSALGNTILMVADRDTLTQNGVDFTDIRLTALGPDGQSLNLPLRAQIYVDQIAQDFGTLSTKTPTTPTTIRYTAPSGPTLVAAQGPTTVTITVTPSNLGDFRGEVIRQVDVRVVPQGVILPANPNLVAAYAFTPSLPQAFQAVSFDATTSTNNSVACSVSCSYAWNFGDGTSGSGLTTTHVFRAVGSFAVTLTVTDARGAQATTTKTISVSTPALPTGTFTTSPTTNLSTNTDIFFSAANVQWAGRTINRYEWNFGDGGAFGSGITTTRRFTTAGTFTIMLTVTDDLGAQARITGSVTISTLGGATANLVVSTSAPKVNARVVFDATTSVPSAGASIVSYRFIYGDGGDETSDAGIQSHVYTAAGTYTVTVVVTDSNGKTATKSTSLTVS